MYGGVCNSIQFGSGSPFSYMYDPSFDSQFTGCNCEGLNNGHLHSTNPYSESCGELQARLQKPSGQIGTEYDYRGFASYEYVGDFTQDVANLARESKYTESVYEGAENFIRAWERSHYYQVFVNGGSKLSQFTGDEWLDAIVNSVWPHGRAMQRNGNSFDYDGVANNGGPTSIIHRTYSPESPGDKRRREERAGQNVRRSTGNYGAIRIPELILPPNDNMILGRPRFGYSPVKRLKTGDIWVEPSVQRKSFLTTRKNKGLVQLFKKYE